MRLKDIRIGVKILVLVIIGILGMAILSFSGYNAMSKASDDLDNMYSRKMKATRMLGDEINYMRMIQVRIVKHILDPKDGQINASIDEAIASYEKTWPDYRDLGMRADKAAAEIPTTEKKWTEYKQGIQEARKLADAGKTQEAWVYYKGVEAGVTQELLKSLVTLQKVADDNAEALNQEIAARNASEMYLMIVTTILCFAVLSGIAFVIIRDIMTTLDHMVAECQRMKDGDFRLNNKNDVRGDEFGQMEDALQEMRKSLNKLMSKVSDSAEQLAASSEELTASANQAAQAATQVAQSATEVVESVEHQQKSVMESNESVQSAEASVEEIRQKSDQVEENSTAAAKRAKAGNQSIDASVSQIKEVEETVTASAEMVDRLGERSKQIGEIVDTMTGIAEQTNLLALNAAIEAARAGEHGRGFTVVAEEVGKLALESKESADKIAGLIKEIQKDTEDAVVSMRSGKASVIEGAQSVESLRSMFEEINQLVAGVSGEISHVTESINAMADATNDIAGEMNDINSYSGKVASEMQAVSAATEEQSASAEEIAAASEALAKLAQDQQEALSRFRF
ncbi:MAG: MCP four helix bundle domain-containing protein [Selenomonas sp.]|uniref:methyl-accepting chemotaxis protein n=1 Tax=Selenomonas sp. TaxID=2053611 RepID=UPI002600E89A|nr:methyl-accepting chemotaxis protein [Selenomonas sp.]MCR5756468.1 MCP four helix bundle domain-containing protein [Selenomonas sp.]